MSDLSEHRLYRYLSEPLRILGLTLDECGVIISASVLGLLADSAVFQLGSYGIGGALFFGLRKFKKMGGVSDMKAFLYWHGFWPKPSSTFPSAYQRILLS